MVFLVRKWSKYCLVSRLYPDKCTFLATPYILLKQLDLWHCIFLVYFVKRYLGILFDILSIVLGIFFTF